MVDPVMFSRKSDEWGTPQELFDELDVEFHFTLDPCAMPRRHLTPESYHSPTGLLLPWKGRVFVNPPYSAIGEWVKKAVDEVGKGNAELVVFLVPARTHTRWFHEYFYRKSNVEIRFLKGRLRFEGGKTGAPFPSMVVVIRGMG